MYRTTICALSYINIISIHITYNAADIANYIIAVIIISTIICSDGFSSKSFIITCAGCHNVAAVINAVCNSIIFRSITIAAVAKIPRYTANIMRTADFVFTVSSIGNIGINSTANNAAYIAALKNISIIF